MNKILKIILVSGFSLTIISCAEKEESTTTTDTAAITSSDDTSDSKSDDLAVVGVRVPLSALYFLLQTQ